ncbi:aldo/keto reductase [Carboxylicivirga linearis]|uniref:Aldo/keto reductase n=1 Tax=Carboxylicivirga linearis TaxID=1628157 RepID=A0ABS5JPN5_9BACT|nr:aldo/keto reductase [Carboxylicivirga linearis]MBS2096797.1 aldo/keto reductase [Carboxylicivirga linearis]
MQTLTFPNNDQMPILGLGTWKSAKGEVTIAVKQAIQLGYRHIDCAAIYMNEKEIGKAIKECIDEGIVKREELWITSKLWNNKHAKEDVIPALQKTLSDLQLDYLDLYLIHWPVAFKPQVFSAMRAEHYLSLEEQPIADTWLGMEKAVDQGLARNIGVCNFSTKKLKDLMEHSRIKPTVNQVEVNPYFQQDKMLEFCNANNIYITAYSPLGSFDRPAGMKAKDEPVLFEDPVLLKLAKNKGLSVAQLILAWIRQRGISVIPKSVNPERQKQNLDSVNIELSEEEMNVVKSINKNRRFVDGSFWEVPGGPYTVANLWDEE